MIATAIPAGFAAGLFGIGGGLVTVPILFYIFSFSGIETAYIMHLAVGTSFGIIIPTSTVSVLTHHQHKAVDFSNNQYTWEVQDDSTETVLMLTAI